MRTLTSEELIQVYGGDGTNRFEGVFGTQATPLAVDVGPEDGQTFVIDIGKRTARRQ